MTMLTRLKQDLTMADAARTHGGARVDLVVVAEMVAPGAKVLDVGCGDGELLRLLAETRGVDGRGIELSREGVNECVAKGLAVIQGDADTAVPVARTRQWVEKLKEQNMTYEYHEIPGGTHGSVIATGMPDIFAFFARHTKGR